MEMQKPYDVEALKAALKAKGIENAERVIRDVVEVSCDWLRSSMAMSKEGIVGHLDDLAIPVVNSFEKIVNSKLEALNPPAPEAPVEAQAEEKPQA